MSMKDRKAKIFEDELTEFSESISQTKTSSIDAKRIRRIHPLGLRVVARVCRDSNVTDSGLYLPEGAKQAAQESILAEVIEVASAVDSHTDEETNVSGIPLGSLILVPKTVGVRVPWDEDLRIVETRDVLAIIDEISVV